MPSHAALRPVTTQHPQVTTQPPNSHNPQHPRHLLGETATPSGTRRIDWTNGCRPARRTDRSRKSRRAGARASVPPFHSSGTGGVPSACQRRPAARRRRARARLCGDAPFDPVCALARRRAACGRSGRVQAQGPRRGVSAGSDGRDSQTACQSRAEPPKSRATAAAPAAWRGSFIWLETDRGGGDLDRSVRWVGSWRTGEHPAPGLALGAVREGLGRSRGRRGQGMRRP